MDISQVLNSAKFVAMQKTTIRYWICQVLGWGGWTMLNVFFVYIFSQDYYLKNAERKRLLFTVLTIQLIWYILSTHLLRFGLKKIRWINFSTDKVIGLFIISVTLTGLFSYYGSKSTAVYTNNSIVEYERREDLKKAIEKEKQTGLAGSKYYLNTPENAKDSVKILAAKNIKQSTGWYRDTAGAWKFEEPRKGRFWWDIIFNFILIALWLLLYMVWHYLIRNRKDEIDKISLEKTVKELELKTIKSHINPHFIFNSLNSIRALVDENPNRARTAITELSNILRSSLQVEKMETVTLQKELDIVKDYLALEQMRFEERLKVVLDIDEDTLTQTVPPMMLQTLVENGIKHGISKSINGGTVKIISKFSGDHFNLIVQNTGTLENEPTEGFGFKGTRDRLRYIYNEKASLKIQEIGENIVEAKIIMPIVH